MTRNRNYQILHSVLIYYYSLFTSYLGLVLFFSLLAYPPKYTLLQYSESVLCRVWCAVCSDYSSLPSLLDGCVVVLFHQIHYVYWTHRFIHNPPPWCMYIPCSCSFHYFGIFIFLFIFALHIEAELKLGRGTTLFPSIIKNFHFYDFIFFDNRQTNQCVVINLHQSYHGWYSTVLFLAISTITTTRSIRHHRSCCLLHNSCGSSCNYHGNGDPCGDDTDEREKLGSGLTMLCRVRDYHHLCCRVRPLWCPGFPRCIETCPITLLASHEFSLCVRTIIGAV